MQVLENDTNPGYLSITRNIFSLCGLVTDGLVVAAQIGQESLHHWIIAVH